MFNFIFCQVSGGVCTQSDSLKISGLVFLPSELFENSDGTQDALQNVRGHVNLNGK